MAGVEFEEDYKKYGTSASPGVTRGGGYNAAPGNSNDPKMVRWLMSHGMSSKAAHGVLFAIIVIDIAVIVLVWKFFI